MAAAPGSGRFNIAMFHCQPASTSSASKEHTTASKRDHFLAFKATGLKNSASVFAIEIISPPE
jgi:hypothetical protein